MGLRPINLSIPERFSHSQEKRGKLTRQRLLISLKTRVPYTLDKILVICESDNEPPLCQTFKSVKRSIEDSVFITSSSPSDEVKLFENGRRFQKLTKLSVELKKDNRNNEIDDDGQKIELISHILSVDVGEPPYEFLKPRRRLFYSFEVVVDL